MWVSGIKFFRSENFSTKWVLLRLIKEKLTFEQKIHHLAVFYFPLCK